MRIWRRNDTQSSRAVLLHVSGVKNLIGLLRAHYGQHEKLIEGPSVHITEALLMYSLELYAEHHVLVAESRKRKNRSIQTIIFVARGESLYLSFLNKNLFPPPPSAYLLVPFCCYILEEFIDFSLRGITFLRHHLPLLLFFIILRTMRSGAKAVPPENKSRKPCPD